LERDYEIRRYSVKKIMQTKFGAKKGNCFDACVASILEYPLEKIPENMMSEDWFLKYQKWLKTIGYQLLNVRLGDGFLPEDIYYIVSGISPRFKDVQHSTVGLNGKIIHDPHPDNTKIKGNKKYWEYTFLLQINKKDSK
jgi:hypothetical protein